MIAQVNLKTGALGYGILYGCIGTGAILGAFLLPKFREHLNFDKIIVTGSLGFGMAIFILALSGNFYFACGGMILGGVSWILVISTLITVVQQVVSTWVRARAMSIFLAIFFGAMAIGSVLWGWVATQCTISTSLFIAAAGLICANLLTYIFTSGERLALDLTPSGRLPAPLVKNEPKYEQGPVMVTTEYFVDPQQLKDFSHVMKDVRRIRLREGSFFWTLFQPVEDTNKFIECFMVNSWLEHLRQHERISISDHEVLDKANTFHKGKGRPRVTHFVAYNMQKK